MLSINLIIPYTIIASEREGFEPSEGTSPQRFSRPPLSTSQASLLLDYQIVQERP